jgi:hypothetical protein
MLSLRRVWRSLLPTEMSSKNSQRVGAVAPSSAQNLVSVPSVNGQYIVPGPQAIGGCGAYTPIVAPFAVPLYPPIYENRPRRERPRPGISVAIAPNQAISGILLLGGINFIDGDISSTATSINIARSGRYQVDFNVTVVYAGAGSAFFQTIPGYGTAIAGGAVGVAGTQIYSGSVILDLVRGSTISFSDTLTGALVTGGTVSVQMLSDNRDRYRRELEEFGEEDIFF